MELDVLDPDSVARAVTPDIEAVVYLVHGRGGDDFEDADQAAANNMVAAINRTQVQLLVYV